MESYFSERWLCPAQKTENFSGLFLIASLVSLLASKILLPVPSRVIAINPRQGASARLLETERRIFIGPETSRRFRAGV